MSTPVSTTTNDPDTRSYQRILDNDTKPVPDVLRLVGDMDVGPVSVPTAVYTDRDVHELEKEKLWTTTWQMVCRIDDVAEIGDTWVHDICDKSILVVHGPEGIKAYYNSCLHRGRPLRDESGRTPALKCPYHGFTWDLDGRIQMIPCRSDFAQIDEGSFDLPQVRVDTWGGFIFINMDEAAEPLSDFVGDLTQHFARWPLDDFVKIGHVRKICPVNWKVAQEAFMEALHVITTHPQAMQALDERGFQHDSFGNFSRGLLAMGQESEFLPFEPTYEDRVRGIIGGWEDEPLPLPIPPDDQPFRAGMAGILRDVFRPMVGDAIEQYCDAEILDVIYYTVFPNLHPWGGMYPYVYRFQPYGDDHTMSIFETMVLMPCPAGVPRPAPAPIRWLGVNDSFMEAPELGLLSSVLNQDAANFVNYQKGLTSSPTKRVLFGEHQELKIRHFYEMWSERTGYPLEDA